jgi:hypothetical protein
MVRLREPHHFKGEGLCAEVPQSPKRDEKIDMLDWERLHPKDNPVE